MPIADFKSKIANRKPKIYLNVILQDDGANVKAIADFQIENGKS